MEVMTSKDFIRPEVACQTFWTAHREIYTVVDGDDFLEVADLEDLDWMDATLHEHFEIKIGERELARRTLE